MGNDEKRVQQFLTIFKTQTPEQLGQLKNAIANRNWEQTSITAHTIKSQCKYLGLEEIVELSFKIEQFAENKSSLESIPKLADQLEEKLIQFIEINLN